jgi:hypothetical protein
MLAGLIFAIDEATDRPGTLAATLPFGGMTLLEYQVRLLTGAGVGQVMVAVARVTPALLNAVNRAVKRGAQVEVVRSAEEASERIAPDARVLVLADGLVTTDPVIDRMAAEGAEALLVTDDAESPAAIERLDMKDCWAGIARVTGAQLGEIATMPADYDFQSALLRVAVQAGAEHVMLAPGWAKSGHVVERSAAALATRGNDVLAALTERRTSWADRWVFNRIARMTLPWLTTKNVPGWALEAGGAVFAVGALGGIFRGWPGAGTVAALVAAALLTGGAAMAALAGKAKRADVLEGAIAALFGLVTMGIANAERVDDASWTPIVLGLVTIGCQLLAERAPVRCKRWWSSPAAHLLILAPFVLADFATIGLAGIAAYAFATLAAAVEATREKA